MTDPGQQRQLQFRAQHYHVTKICESLLAEVEGRKMEAILEVHQRDSI